METTFKELAVKRGHIKSSLTRFQNYCQCFDRKGSVRELQERVKCASTLLDKFDDIQTQIDVLVVGTNLDATQAAERDSFEKLYYTSIAAAKEIIEKARAAALTIPSPAFDAPIGIQPQTIPLPSFDGSYERWIQFRDTFQTLIHCNDALTNIQKFHYLISTLKGDAARVIQSLSVTEANYDIAWKNLSDRFEDPQTLIRHHVSRLFHLPSINKPSFSGLRQLASDTNNHLLALKSINEPLDTWVTLAIYLITSKLDHTTKREWDKRWISTSGKPSLKTLTEFLEHQCKYLGRFTLEKLRGSSKSSDVGKNHQTTGTVSKVARPTRLCKLCKGVHTLYQCQVLKKFNIAMRRQKARHSVSGIIEKK